MKKLIAITLLSTFSFAGVAHGYTQTWYGTDTGDTIILTPDVQGDLPTNYYTAQQSDACSYLVDDYDEELDQIDSTRGVPSSVKNTKRYNLLTEYNTEIYECLIEERAEIKKEIKELEEERKELLEKKAQKEAREAARKAKETKEIKIEKQPDEVELTPDKRMQAVSMILALKASGEPLTLENLFPIIIMLRN